MTTNPRTGQYSNRVKDLRASHELRVSIVQWDSRYGAVPYIELIAGCSWGELDADSARALAAALVKAAGEVDDHSNRS